MLYTEINVFFFNFYHFKNQLKFLTKKKEIDNAMKPIVTLLYGAKQNDKHLGKCRVTLFNSKPEQV